MAARARRRRWLGAATALALALACSGGETGGEPAEAAREAAASEEPGALRGVDELRDDPVVVALLEPWTGDLDGIYERGYLRVLTSFSPTGYRLVKGREEGFEVEMMRSLAKHLNEGRNGAANKLRVAFVPVPFDRLIPLLEGGHGDLVAAGMTVTPERSERVHFSSPYLPDVSEVVLARKGTPAAAFTKVEDLSGTKAHVVRGSSYVESLERLNQQLEAADLAPVIVEQVDEELDSGDLIEMVGAGILDYTVADAHVANAWAGVLDEVVVLEDVTLRTGGQLAWAMRQSSPQLAAALESFVGEHEKGSLMGNMLFSRYFEKDRKLGNPVDTAEQERLQEYVEYFQTHADEHGFDWLQLAAQAYRESRLDQSRRSRAGAIGIMQIKPATAKDVGVTDISTAGNNIEAGAAYLAYLRDRYFTDESIPPDARVHLALAAYNAGPARIRKLRAATAAQGLDPDVWFDNVEHVTLAQVGPEPVEYVADIQKYYVAYRLNLRSSEAKGQVEVEVQ